MFSFRAVTVIQRSKQTGIRQSLSVVNPPLTSIDPELPHVWERMQKVHSFSKMYLSKAAERKNRLETNWSELQNVAVQKLRFQVSWRKYVL